MSRTLINGEIADLVSANDRGLAYGDGLFETIAVFRGQPRFWQAHMDRLGQGCERLGLPQPPQELLLRELRTLAAGQVQCVVKIILTRAAGKRGYAPGASAPVNRILSVHDFPAGVRRDAQLGVAARTLTLRLAIQPALGGIKHLNRLENVLAARELAEDPPGHEGLLLDAEGHVISAVAANLFLVFNGMLLTPRTDRCGVRGVMRAMLIREFKARCELRRMTPDMLVDAHEAFICNAVRGIVPLIRIDSRELEIGPLTREVQAWLHEDHRPS